ncbi:MAG: adenosylcobinamide-phosphate synthase CbiB [Motiliproteus sp.]|nr:adenosylcobinamide-phosphate synthase CbiB [Motiliproteus sp.]MCW9053117.1 adenosylcobinamide-phosphate synthase CbiB [Motiliproteus sp.]
MTTALIILLALLLDRWLGEPRRWHPLVGFGHIAIRLERLLNTPGHMQAKRLAGIASVAALTLIPVLIVGQLLSWLQPASLLFHLVQILGLYFCIGRQSLSEHARAVATPLTQGDVQQAREQVGMIVSRDSAEMTPQQITNATVETLLENANDACFATLFWFAIGGLPLALLHRFSNTLDAMWGYRSDRYLHFGWAAARLDDLLNWIPARLGALALAIAGQTQRGLHCWKTQGHQYDSPNGGVIMATGAGALGIRLGGKAIYQGQVKERTVLGQGRPAQAMDIERSIILVNQAVMLWIVILMLLGTL